MRRAGGRRQPQRLTERARLPAPAARDIDAGANLQTLLISAVVAVVATRLGLELAGWPRVGGGGLHIAHLLWGGLLMLVALVVQIALLGKAARRAASVIGGLGFGLFVDELGKFVTADNDYFFQPAIALIYVLFIVLFLAFRAIERRSLSADELLVNAADMVREVVMGGATRAEIVRARRLLNRSSFHGPLADALRESIDSATRSPERKSWLTTFARKAWTTYDRLLEWRWFQRAIWLIFTIRALVGLATASLAIWAAVNSDVPPLLQQLALLTSTLSLAALWIGVVRLPRSRLAAYRWFERGILISVFFTQVVLFWQGQLATVLSLCWDLALLTVVRFMVRQEEARQALGSATRPPAAVTHL